MWLAPKIDGYQSADPKPLGSLQRDKGAGAISLMAGMVDTHRFSVVAFPQNSSGHGKEGQLIFAGLILKGSPALQNTRE